MGGGLENRCVGRVYGADGASRQRFSRPPPIRKSRKTIRSNSTSNAPDDGRMLSKHVELRKLQ